ncbi:ribonuclease H-like domain-containing protein [Tanacetum coccineum]|uniref:Ribonuclease H-like domain-containing protein n=1 Tax=Tanacetum coccineum TaxID=301880 RepID=A0ABQ5A9P9_9ASTR
MKNLLKSLKENDFVQSVNDHSLFTKSKNNKFIALLVYVDDIVVTGNCVDKIEKFKKFPESKFKIKDLGSLKYFLGIEVIKTGNDLCRSRRKYCLELLKEYGLLGCKPVSTPMEPNFVLPYIATKEDPLYDNVTGYQKLLALLLYVHWLVIASDDDDNSNKKGDKSIGSSSELNLSFGDSLYLHPNDTGGSPIVTIKLTSTENYKMWSITMTFALRNHNKLDFIDGSCKKDNYKPALDTYDKVDGSAVFNLHKNINSLNQNGAPFADYYNNLNSLWKQFDALISLPPCTCEAAKHFEKHNQLLKLM